VTEYPNILSCLQQTRFYDTQSFYEKKTDHPCRITKKKQKKEYIEFASKLQMVFSTD